MAVGESVREDLLEKVKRYGVAELVGTAATYAGYNLADNMLDNPVLSAYAAVMCENLGFYGTMAIQQVVIDARKAISTAKKYTLRNAITTVRDLIKEFAGSELLDTFVVRPMTIGTGEKLLGGTGIIIGKWLADAIFFIISHETRKRIEAVTEKTPKT